MLSVNAKQKGMSLVELLVVLAILSVSSAAATGLLRHTSPSIALRSASAMLESDLRAERQRALANGTISEISIDTDTYDLERIGVQKKWPNGVNVSLSNDKKLRLSFFEDGTSNGAVILLRKGKHSTVVKISSLTGAISSET